MFKIHFLFNAESLLLEQVSPLHLMSIGSATLLVMLLSITPTSPSLLFVDLNICLQPACLPTCPFLTSTSPPCYKHTYEYQHTCTHTPWHLKGGQSTTYVCEVCQSQRGVSLISRPLLSGSEVMRESARVHVSPIWASHCTLEFSHFPTDMSQTHQEN